MHDIDPEAVRASMFAHPGIKAVDGDVRLFHTAQGHLGVAATITVAAPDVDQETVRRTVAAVLQEHFGIDEVDLRFKPAGPVPDHAAEPRGPLEKK